MSSPAMTWKVRRIGHGLWSSVHASNRTAWSWIERVQRTVSATQSAGAEQRQTSARQRRSDDRYVAGDSHPWLTALRLDRAATALAESD